MLRLVILLAVGVMGTPVRAQPRAVSVEATHHHHPHPPAGLGAGLAFGWAGQRNGPSGWSARLEYELFPFIDSGKLGGLFGAQPAFEVWRSGEDNWGFSLPVAIVGGIRVFPLRAVVGGGVDAILVDQVNDDTGVGLYAPFAVAKLGVDVAGFQIGADARIGYHWQFGADDHARWQFGIYIAKTMFTPTTLPK